MLNSCGFVSEGITFRGLKILVCTAPSLWSIQGEHCPICLGKNLLLAFSPERHASLCYPLLIRHNVPFFFIIITISAAQKSCLQLQDDDDDDNKENDNDDEDCGDDER